MRGFGGCFYCKNPPGKEIPGDRKGIWAYTTYEYAMKSGFAREISLNKSISRCPGEVKIDRMRFSLFCSVVFRFWALHSVLHLLQKSLIFRGKLIKINARISAFYCKEFGSTMRFVKPFRLVEPCSVILLFGAGGGGRTRSDCYYVSVYCSCVAFGVAFAPEIRLFCLFRMRSA